MSRRNHKIRRSPDTPPSYWQKFGNWVEKLTDNIFGKILLQAIVSSTFVGIVDMIYSSDGKWSLIFLPLIITVGCIALYFFILLIVFLAGKPNLVDASCCKVEVINGKKAALFLAFLFREYKVPNP